MSRLRFGTFLAPFHVPGQNPTRALHHDLALIQYMDHLGYDEAWIGEHHSAGSEIIPSPEIFIAAASMITKNIRFGTGVTSVSYHNPMWVADRMVMLDHLSRGRTMLGLGPGSLPTDSAMIGLNPTQTRELLEINTDIIVRLLRGEVVNEETLTHKFVDAQLQLMPYTDPCFEIAVAAVASPTGARLAGKYGLNLLSIGATLTSEGFDALGLHWQVMEEQAKEYGTTVDRSGWRLVTPMHIAPTREQAEKEVEFGIEAWFNYFQHIAAFPQMGVEGGNLKEMIAFIKDAGVGVIGTAEDAVEKINKLQDQSGGFGCVLLLAHDWADPEATRRSLDIIARDVMPEFQGQRQPTIAAAERAAKQRDAGNQAQLSAVAHMTEKYEAEKARRAGAQS